jgi:thiamine phosphate synthase YjbQ (UPF0047 family)
MRSLTRHLTMNVPARMGFVNLTEVERAVAESGVRPQRYQHNRTGEDNADAHHKRQIMGREVAVAVTDGRLDFGPWEQIFYGELDGRRPKRVMVKIIGPVPLGVDTPSWINLVPRAQGGAPS